MCRTPSIPQTTSERLSFNIQSQWVIGVPNRKVSSDASGFCFSARKVPVAHKSPPAAAALFKKTRLVLKPFRTLPYRRSSHQNSTKKEASRFLLNRDWEILMKTFGGWIRKRRTQS